MDLGFEMVIVSFLSLKSYLRFVWHLENRLGYTMGIQDFHLIYMVFVFHGRMQSNTVMLNFSAAIEQLSTVCFKHRHNLYPTSKVIYFY